MLLQTYMWRVGISIIDVLQCWSASLGCCRLLQCSCDGTYHTHVVATVGYMWISDIAGSVCPCTQAALTDVCMQRVSMHMHMAMLPGMWS